MEEKIKFQNEWARTNIPKDEQMVCEECGRIVAYDWMRAQYWKGVGQRCGPCVNKK